MIEQLIRDYDMLALKNLYPQWPELDLRARFACIKGFLFDRDHAGAEKIAQEHRDFLKDCHIYHHLRLGIDRETQGNFASALASSLSEDMSRISDPYVRGEHAFMLGFAFIQCGQFELAQEYLRRSLQEFEGELFRAYAWRSKFNLALCHIKLNQQTEFEIVLQDLERSITELTPRARLYLARLLVWLYLYLDSVDLARDLILKQVSTGTDYRESYLLKYLLFIHIKTERWDAFDLIFARYEACLHARDRQVALDLLRCRHGERIELDVQRDHLLDLQLLAEARLRTELRSGNFENLRGSYEWMQKNILPLKVVLPATELRGFGLIAYRETGRKQAYNKLLAQFQATAPDWRQREFEKLIVELEHRRSHRPLTLDLGAQTLTCSEVIFELKKRPRMLAFLAEVFHAKSGISIPALGAKLYRDKNFDVHRSRIAALIVGSRRLLGMDFLEVNENHLRVSQGFQAQIVRDSSAGQKERLANILRFAQSTKYPFSVGEVTSYLKYPRRSIQSDLQILVKRGRLSQRGKGRSSRYML
jgi:hypothetical protein